MMPITRDPAGLLERVPELQELAQHNPRIVKEIERGRPHALYRELLWMRWFGRGRGGQLPILDKMIASRRWFVEPMRRGPWLTTLNGVGGKLYGEAEQDRDDGTFITTLFIVFLFVPIYPFTSYLARRAGNRQWQFFARVPLAPALYLWQRGLAAALAGVAITGGARTYLASQYQQIHVANALPTPVQARIGNQAITVPSAAVRSLRVRVGLQPVTITAAGKTIEKGNIEASHNFALQVWNVLGLGLIYLEHVEYRLNGQGDAHGNPRSEPEVHCGESAIAIRDVDYPLVDPPKQLSMSSSHPHVTKSHAGFQSDVSCAQYLFGRHDSARAAEMLAQIAEATGYERARTESAVQLLTQFGKPGRASAFAERALQAHPGDVEFERFYQDALLRDGRRDEMLTRYQRRWREHQGQADDAYLYARLLPVKEAEPILQDTLQRFPDNAYLLRMQVFHDDLDAAPEQVLVSFEKLQRVAPAMASEMLDVDLRALVSSGRVPAARQKVQQFFQSAPANGRFMLEKWLVLLSHFEPKTSVEEVIAAIANSPEGKFDAARIRIEGRLNIDPKEVEALEAGPVRDALAIELLARTQPAAALAGVAKAGEITLHLLAPEVWGLLIGEAARTDDAALAPLSSVGLAGEAAANCVVRYVREGSDCREFEYLSGAQRSALHFARARVANLREAERRMLLATARREDALRGLVTQAIDTWQ